MGFRDGVRGRVSPLEGEELDGYTRYSQEDVTGEFHVYDDLLRYCTDDLLDSQRRLGGLVEQMPGNLVCRAINGALQEEDRDGSIHAATECSECDVDEVSEMINGYFL